MLDSDYNLRHGGQVFDVLNDHRLQIIRCLYALGPAIHHAGFNFMVGFGRRLIQSRINFYFFPTVLAGANVVAVVVQHIILRFR